VKRIVLALAVAGTVLALTAGTALAQATIVEKSNVKVPLDRVVENSCTGELIQLTGDLHMLIQVTEDADGGLHVRTHSQPQGVSGTGLSSGTTYRGVGVNQRVVYVPPESLLKVHTLVSRFYFVSEGPSENLLVSDTVHVTFNADHEPTVDFVHADIRCAG
jgi:hypothetical protein